MKRLTSILLVLLMLCALAVPVSAEDGPVILWQPQNPIYPEGSYALYTVTTAAQENLTCKWWLNYNGHLFDLDAADGSYAWEEYAGNFYGANRDGYTFGYYFNGIKAGLDGATIYAEISNGSSVVYSTTSVIRVGGTAQPPKVTVPESMEVFCGETLDIYCNATAPNGEELSYIWYETSSGALQDIVALDRGNQTTDTLRCDTSQEGLRYYVCMVTTDAGGVAYSSVIPVLCRKNTVPAQIPVRFTADSKPEVGGKLQVDIRAMIDADARLYNAFLEKDIHYEWHENDVIMTGVTGDTLTITEANVGKEYYVLVSAYDLTLKSDNIKIEKTTLVTPPMKLQDGTVGQPYRIVLLSTIPNGVYTVAEKEGGPNEFGKTGLTLSSEGVLEGTPTEAGTFGFTLCLAGEGKEMYTDYTLTVAPGAQTVPTEVTEPTLEDVDPPENGIDISLNNTADGTDTDVNDKAESDDSTVLIIILACVAGLAVAAVVVLLILRKKKK